MDDIEARLARLEAQLSGARRLAYAGWLVAAAAALACKPTPLTSIVIAGTTLDEHGLVLKRGDVTTEITPGKIELRDAHAGDVELILRPSSLLAASPSGIAALDTQPNPILQLTGTKDRWIQLLVTDWATVNARHDPDHYIQLLATPDGGKIDRSPQTKP